MAIVNQQNNIVKKSKRFFKNRKRKVLELSPFAFCCLPLQNPG